MREGVTVFLSPQDQITITGYEHKAIAARDAIQAIVDELEEMISEDITLDSRVHARIIGARGKGIRKIMDEFKVRKQFKVSELCLDRGSVITVSLYVHGVCQKPELHPLRVPL